MLFTFQDDRVVGLQHDELQLNVIGNVRMPNPFALQLKVNVELNVVLNLVVLWIRTVFD